MHDSRTFTLGSYLTAALPAPAPIVDNYSGVSTWPMYDNDKWGDCTCAAAGHMVQAWTAAASAEVTPPDSAIDAMYEHFVGNPPPDDAGCNMLSVLKYWRHTGLGKTDKITAFAAIQLKNHDQLRTAVSLFGSAYLGVALPDDVCVPGKMLTTHGSSRPAARSARLHRIQTMATASLSSATTRTPSTWSPGARSKP